MEEQEVTDYTSKLNGDFIEMALEKALYPDSEPKKGSQRLISSEAVFNVLPRLSSISLSSSWSGNDPYSQVVHIQNQTITSKTKVDLQPTSSQIEALKEARVISLYIENNNGVLTAVAFGGPPSDAMTIQCTLYEVMT